ncbi:MAG: ABC transporter permease, partial [Chloroflexi bacterium]|nr:ABC transporter permease [Chloroflexota bacterium]
ISMIVGAASVLVAGLTGTLLGLVAGHFGGLVDGALMRIVDTWQAVPSLVLAIAVAVVLGQGLLGVILVLAFTTWVIYARIVRGQVLSLRELEYVQAARALGAGELRIIFRHLLPGVTTSLVVVATQQLAAMILFEGFLSFLGLGVQPPTPTWGGMVADGRNYIATAWWVSTLPGVAISFAVLGINLLGDWLRDLLGPRQSA